VKVEVQSIVPEFMVNDVGLSARFYSETFGFQMTARAPESGKITWAELTTGAQSIMLQSKGDMLLEMPSLSSRMVGGTMVLVLRIGSGEVIRELYANISRKHEVVLPIRQTDYGTVEFAICDPDGYIILASGK
jgi:uncharacterized glyoxalase superfamily protein PhnB